MREQRGTRRWLFGVLAASAALGAGHGASAGDNAPRPRPDYGSKEAFRLECELLGGTFIDDGIGNTICTLSGVGRVVCDANGNDCWFTPASWQQPPGGANQIDGPLDAVATDDQPSVVAPADDQEPKAKAKHGKGKKGKHGKKHRHGGKRRT